MICKLNNKKPQTLAQERSLEINWSKSVILQMGRLRFEEARDMSNVPQLGSGREKTNLGLLIPNSVLFSCTMCFLNLGHKQEPANNEYSFTTFSLITVNKLYFIQNCISNGTELQENDFKILELLSKVSLPHSPKTQLFMSFCVVNRCEHQ